MGERNTLILPEPADPELLDAIRSYREGDTGKRATRRQRRQKRAAKKLSRAKRYPSDEIGRVAIVVKKRLREAGRTLRGLSLPREYSGLRNMRVCWPEMKRELFHDEPKARTGTIRPRPTPDQISRLEECLGWLLWHDAETRKLLGAWMVGTKWEEIEDAFGFSRWTGARRIDSAVYDIAMRLVVSASTGSVPQAIVAGGGGDGD